MIRIREIFFTLFAALVVVVVSMFFVGGVVGMILQGLGASQDAIMRSILLLILAGASPGVLAGIHFVFVRPRRHTTGDGWKLVGYRPTTARWCLSAVAVTLVFEAIYSLAESLLVDTGDQTRQIVGSFISIHDPSVPLVIATLIAFGPLTALWEEGLFRGVILKGIKGRTGFAGGAIISSLIFGLAHVQSIDHITAQDINQFVGTFALGLIFAWFSEKSGSLWPAVAAHAVNNMVIVIDVLWF